MPKKLTERYTIKKTSNPGSKKQVFLVQGYRPEGQRVRHTFENRADANEHRNALYLADEESGNLRSLQRTTLTPTQIADAEAAFDLIAGRSLTAAVSQYHELERRVQAVSNAGLESAIQFFENHYQAELQEITIYNAVQRFLHNKKHLAAQTQSYYNRCTKVLLNDDPNKLVNLFTKKDIYDLLGRYGTVETQKIYKRGFSVFFRWCVNQAHCLENPCDKVVLPGRSNRQIHILSLDDSKRALKASTILFNGVMAPSVAILLFAGLRPSELHDLRPEDIKDDYIVVRGGKVKRTKRRRKPICATLNAWFEAYPFKGSPVGWNKKLTALNKAYKPEIRVPDIFRHTSLSFQLEVEKDEARVAFENGTSIQMLHQHYIDMVPSPQDAIAFWSLTPEVIEKVDLKIPEKKNQAIQWPARTKLAKLVYEKPLSRLAKDLGCSDNAIRKHCLKQGIELPKNGYWQRKRAMG